MVKGYHVIHASNRPLFRYRSLIRPIAPNPRPMSRQSIPVVAIALLLTSSCASIVSRSSYPVTINSTPARAGISIVDKQGRQVYQGATPATLMLSASSGFFSKASYQVTFDLPGYDRRVVPIECKLDGWYFGNVLFGGLIGMLIVDPASGAMFKVDTPFIDEQLSRSLATDAQQLRVYDINEIPADWKARLVQIGE